MTDFKLYALSKDEARFLAQLVEKFVTGKEPVNPVDTANVSLTILERLRFPNAEIAQDVLPVVATARAVAQWTPLTSGDVFDADGSEYSAVLHVLEGGERLEMRWMQEAVMIDLPAAYRLCVGNVAAQRHAARSSRAVRLAESKLVKTDDPEGDNYGNA